jgi:hypothetical protein
VKADLSKLPDLTKLPPLVHYVIAAVTASTALLLTQGFIENRTEKLVDGLAAIWLPIAYLLLVALYRLAHARETAARINSGQPTEFRQAP